MFDRGVSKILARCLEDVENGRLSAEECLHQHPEHAEELRQYLDLREQLARLQQPQSSPRAQQQGRQQLLTALASQPDQGVPQKMIPNLLSSAIAKAIAGVLAGTILLGGAAGASAAGAGAGAGAGAAFGAGAFMTGFGARASLVMGEPT